MKYFSFVLISYLKRNFNAVNIISKKKKNKFTNTTNLATHDLEIEDAHQTSVTFWNGAIDSVGGFVGNLLTRSKFPLNVYSTLTPMN